MRIGLLLPCTCFAVLLSACGPTQESSPYQLVSTKDGKTIRLNTQTGDVHLVTDKGLIRLTDDNPVLEVGEY
jgi:hypothetical protein